VVQNESCECSGTHSLENSLCESANNKTSCTHRSRFWPTDSQLTNCMAAAEAHSAVRMEMYERAPTRSTTTHSEREIKPVGGAPPAVQPCGHALPSSLLHSPARSVALVCSSASDSYPCAQSLSQHLHVRALTHSRGAALRSFLFRYPYHLLNCLYLPSTTSPNGLRLTLTTIGSTCAYMENK
jgi:hypothetical protein